MAIGRNSLRPGYLRVMSHKVLLRWQTRNARSSLAAVGAWCEAQQEDEAAWASDLDAALWSDAEAFAVSHARYIEPKLAEIGVHMGGGGHYALLYFLTRYLRPHTIVETGVAAGHSSRCFLMALRVNGSGRLLSSDFPLFRLDDPERLIGHLVEQELREGWVCLIQGDRANLPVLIDQAGTVDLFHYDSDKSVNGRDFALRCLRGRLSAGGAVVFDDIQDNWHFRDLMQRHPGTAKIFAFQGKYIGLLLPPHIPELIGNTDPQRRGGAAEN